MIACSQFKCIQTLVTVAYTYYLFALFQELERKQRISRVEIKFLSDQHEIGNDVRVFILSFDNMARDGTRISKYNNKQMS